MAVRTPALPFAIEAGVLSLPHPSVSYDPHGFPQDYYRQILRFLWNSRRITRWDLTLELHPKHSQGLYQVQAFTDQLSVSVNHFDGNKLQALEPYEPAIYWCLHNKPRP